MTRPSASSARRVPLARIRASASCSAAVRLGKQTAELLPTSAPPRSSEDVPRVHREGEHAPSLGLTSTSGRVPSTLGHWLGKAPRPFESSVAPLHDPRSSDPALLPSASRTRLPRPGRGQDYFWSARHWKLISSSPLWDMTTTAPWSAD